MTAGLAALLLLLPAQQPQGAASQPAAAAQPGVPGTAADVYGELTLIYEMSEKALRAQESWTLRNMSGKQVPASALTITLQGVRKLRLDETATGFTAAEDNSQITAAKPMGQEDRTVAGTYEVPTSGSTLVIRRKLPFNMARARVIFEEVPGLNLSSNVTFTKRVRDLNGVKFAIWDFPGMPPGTELELRVTGLPSRQEWPRTAAVVTAILILFWMVWALVKKRAPGAEHAVKLGPLSARARRDRLVKAIEILKRDHDEGKLDDKRYARRHEALLQELAVVLRELDIEERQTAQVASGARTG